MFVLNITSIFSFFGEATFCMNLGLKHLVMVAVYVYSQVNPVEHFDLSVKNFLMCEETDYGIFNSRFVY